MRRTWAAAAAVAASLALVGASQGTSQAAQPAPTQSVPSCIEVLAGEFISIYVTRIENHCSITHSVTPVYENTVPGEFPCFTLSPGEHVTHEVNYFYGSGDFDRIVLC